MLCLFVDACVCSVLLIVLDVLFLLPLMVNHKYFVLDDTKCKGGRNPLHGDRDSYNPTLCLCIRYRLPSLLLSLLNNVAHQRWIFFILVALPQGLFLQCSKKNESFFFDDCRAYPNFVCRCFCSPVCLLLYFSLFHAPER